MLTYMSDYLTTGQVARELGLSINALQQWAKDGVVTPAFTTPGGRMRWTVDGLLGQLGGDTTTPPTPRTVVPIPIILAIITAREGVAIGRRTEPPPPWSFIGGDEIEDGESAATAAVRVARQDAQIKVRAGAHLGQRLHPATNRLVTYVACVPATRGPEHPITVGDETRFTEVKWVSLSEATELMPDMDPRVLAHLSRVMRRR
jgi:8-oxo-dGTP diphosphatase